MSTLHDAEIVSYTADFKSNTVTLFTEYWYDDTCSKNTVVFEQVVAHSFQDIGEMRNILFDITQFFTDHVTLLGNRKNYGWPLIHYCDRADLLDQLQ